MPKVMKAMKRITTCLVKCLRGVQLSLSGVQLSLKSSTFKKLSFNLFQMNKIIALCFILLLVTRSEAQKKNALTVKEKNISMPGKQIDINTDGFPAMIQTSFNLVTEPVHFHVVKASSHKDIKWKSGPLDIKTQKPEKVSWVVKNTSDSLNMDVEGTIKPNGTLVYTVKIIALNDINLDNIRLHLPFTTEAAKYIKGMGREESLRPEAVDWKWNAGNTGQNSVWVGDVNGGLQYELTDQKYKATPASWANDGQGGIHIEQKGKLSLPTITVERTT